MSEHPVSAVNNALWRLQEDWEICIGRLLLSMHHHDSQAIQRGLQEARNRIMKPLAAAATESYSRAYPLMVHLHMLQELQDAHATVEVI